MNQHTLACRHFGDMPERVGGGNECNWNCHGIDAAQVARVTRKQARGAANMRTQGGSNQSEDSVSDAKVGHALADCHDTPGGLRTEHEVIVQFSRIHAERFHDISEVQRGGLDLHFDFSRAGTTPLDRYQHQVVQYPGLGDLQAERGAPRQLTNSARGRRTECQTQGVVRRAWTSKLYARESG